MLNFCTLFDSNYLIKGLCMYDSLKQTCPDFHLYIFAFDDKAYLLLKSLNLKFVSVISLSEFEDDELLQIKGTRSKGEYCWTCTSSTILYCIQRYSLSHCTYIDADLYFYSDPKVLIDEMGDNDVLITSHRYTPEYDQTTKSGKYCVQFMTFRNTENGINVLKWWRNACIAWCYARFENGKFGDQMYLDDWTTRFTGIHELEHLGGGVAPWNMQQYSFRKQDNIWKGVELSSGRTFDLVFFHFHAILSCQKGFLREFYFNFYKLPRSTRRYIYLPYVSILKKHYQFIKQMDGQLDGLATKKLKITWGMYTLKIAKRLLINNNAYTYWLD